MARKSKYLYSQEAWSLGLLNGSWQPATNETPECEQNEQFCQLHKYNTNEDFAIASSP
jgi:hypothetical protein